MWLSVSAMVLKMLVFQTQYSSFSATYPIFSRFLFGDAALAYGHKKRAPLSPTFVNLKSNTMKNTLQRYGGWNNLQIIQGKKCVL